MRQLSSLAIILVVVAMVATFAVGSIYSVVHANAVLQQSVAALDELYFAETMDQCDVLDAAPCL